MPTLRQTVNAKLFDDWHLGAPKTPKFVYAYLTVFLPSGIPHDSRTEDPRLAFPAHESMGNRHPCSLPHIRQARTFPSFISPLAIPELSQS